MEGEEEAKLNLWSCNLWSWFQRMVGRCWGCYRAWCCLIYLVVLASEGQCLETKDAALCSLGTNCTTSLHQLREKPRLADRALLP